MGDEARALLGGLLELRRDRPGRLPLAPGAGRRVQLARARAAGARGRVGGGLAQRGPAAPRGVPGGAAPGRPRGDPRPARRPARPGRPRWWTSPSATPTTSRPTTPTSSRPSPPRSATCSWPTPTRPCATPNACGPSTAGSTWSVAGAGGSAGSRWPLDRDAPRRAARLRRRGDAHEGRDVAGRRLRGAGRRGRDRRDPRVAARPGPRDPCQPGVRRREPGRPPQPRQRPDAAEAQPLRPGGDPHPGGHRGRRPGRRCWSPCTPARPARTTSTC